MHDQESQGVSSTDAEIGGGAANTPEEPRNEPRYAEPNIDYSNNSSIIVISIILNSSVSES